MILQRDSQDSIRTLGTMQDDDSSVVCQTLELPWLDNDPNVSCIPAGTYQCWLRWSQEHQRDLYWVTQVPRRSDVVGCTSAALSLEHERLYIARRLP